ncbi:MAG: LemA family protein [Planctomycetota bacterium]|jgi:LemA protein
MAPVALVLAAAAVTVYAVWIFNRLIRLRARARNAWSDVDVQLKRRWELVPPLVETVRGYAAHESGTLEQVVEARAGAERAHDELDRGSSEARVSRGLHDLLVLAEAYPDLKADGLFRSLHEQLVDIEAHLQAARRYYNAVVRDLNTTIQMFPHSLVARSFRFHTREFFQLDDSAESAVPSIEWSRP